MRIRVPESIVPVVLKAANAKEPFATEEGAHKRIRERFLRPVSYSPPEKLDGVQVDRRFPNPRGWPVYDIAPEPESRGGGINTSVVVYVHGGGWVNQITSFHWQLIARIARDTRQRVVVPIHPLVPFGHARDVREGVVELIADELDSGNEVRLAGDSSGGQIALSTALKLRDDGVVLPATTLLSPALDLTWSNPKIPEVEPVDPWLARPGGTVLADAWRGDDDLEDPVVSPLFGDMAGLGPLTILSGTRDVLNPDANVLLAKAKEAGVSVDWHQEEDQLHVYALLPTRAGKRGADVIVESVRPAAGS